MQREYPYIVIRYSESMHAHDGCGFILEFCKPDQLVGDQYDNDWEFRIEGGLRFASINGVADYLDYRPDHFKTDKPSPEKDYPIGSRG